jgi:hypothetical protein
MARRRTPELAAVESIGLPEKQESAVKGLVRQAVWDDINAPTCIMFMEHEYPKVYSLINQITEAKIGGTVEIRPLSKSK